MKIGFWIFGVAFFVLFCCVQSTVFAVSDTDLFRVRAFVGDDTTPPTTPEFTSVVPVTSQQINVEWSASTDDVLLIAYRLYRDGEQIATTSQTSFNDTGLTPETLYTYTVDAYDSFDNVSSTSVPVATTTLAIPVVPTSTPTTTRTQTSTLVTRLDSFSVTPEQRSALFRFQTNTNTRYTLSWGRTTSYELGTISTNIFKQAHETTIENLEPGTRYWYTLLATNSAGFTTMVQSGDFMTVAAFESMLPPNVRNVNVTVLGTDVSLSWLNPPLSTGEVVRVVRSHLFYPFSATDGALVYEGNGSAIVDTDALLVRSPQYYTIFVIDKNGAVSSGAIALAQKTDVVPVSIPPLLPVVPTPIPPTVITESGDVKVLRADNVFIKQGAVTHTMVSPILLEYDTEYTIYIPVEAVTPHLKSIIVSVQDPTDQRIVTTYLLKRNQAGDAYEAVVAAPGVVGTARIQIEVYDFNFASVRRISTSLTFVPPKTTPVVFPDDMVRYGKVLLLPIVFCGIALLAWWLIIVRRRHQREDNN